MAVIGAGGFGQLHAQTVARLPGALLVAVVDTDGERARGVAAPFGAEVRAFADMDALIEHGGVDAVVIATRADSHLPLARRAIAAGLHAFIEKPLAHSSREIELFLGEAQSCGRVVMVDHLCLFHSLITPLLVQLGGQPLRALHFTRHRPDAIGRHFQDDHPIQLTMVHDLYVAARLVGGEEPISFHAMEARNQEGRADMSWAMLRWRDGRTATFHCHMMLPEGAPGEGWDFLEVFGDGLHSRVNTNPAPWTLTTDRMRWPAALEIGVAGDHATGMLAEIWNAFLASCRGAPVPEGCRVRDALQVQRWIEKLLAEAAHQT